MIWKKKKKLLEYIIFESIQRRKEFEKEVSYLNKNLFL